MLKTIKKLFPISCLVASLLFSSGAFAVEESSGIIDDSVRDISIVLGAGAAGAVLGLSTLSFVDHPSEHMKNIAIGGAIGIVFGVAAVIFSQATKTTLSYAPPHTPSEVPMNAAKLETLARQDFTQTKIASEHFQANNIGYNFSF